MIQANELRIGNLILKASDTFMIKDVYDLGLVIRHPERYKPIPLAEEWLVKFGFNRITCNSPVYDRDDFWAGEIGSDNRMAFDDLEISIQHVHQLQNLYFALTGKELTL